MLSLFLIVCIILSCGKDAPADIPPDPTDPQNPPPADTTALSPSASLLTGPANNTACLSGVAVNDTTKTVNFEWMASSNTDAYQLVIINATTGKQYSKNTTSLNAELPLPANQAYKWYVVSTSSTSSDTARSTTWQFYLAGVSLSSYAPFPATPIAPVNNEVVNTNGATPPLVTLKWKAEDIDGDISGYTVYFDEADATTKITTLQTATSLARLVVPGKTYYWRIVTTDKAGNSSDSGKFKFTVQ